jgi:hypothetical protein
MLDLTVSKTRGASRKVKRGAYTLTVRNVGRANERLDAGHTLPSGLTATALAGGRALTARCTRRSPRRASYPASR